MIIDRAHVITGSFNLTPTAAKRNAENVLLVTDDPKTAEAYAGNFHERAVGARPLP
jgi:phosphatidylserine/phosphatidylglycerophosphate/cardiolipin synthase-like enzyme